MQSIQSVLPTAVSHGATTAMISEVKRHTAQQNITTNAASVACPV